MKAMKYEISYITIRDINAESPSFWEMDLLDVRMLTLHIVNELARI